MRPLAAIGNVNVDLILGPAEPWPKPGTEVIVDHDELRVGGCAGNNALAWDSLGVDYVIAANVGNDQFGTWLKEAFGERSRNWPVEAVGTTLSVGITHPDGERTFFTTRGHLPLFSFPEVHSMLDGNRLRGGYALLSGSFLTDALTLAYDALFDWADAHEIAVALDTGWPLDGWTETNRLRTLGWLKRCHCALFNEVETTTLTGLSDPAEAALSLKGEMPAEAIVVVKRGPMERSPSIGTAELFPYRRRRFRSSIRSAPATSSMRASWRHSPPKCHSKPASRPGSRSPRKRSPPFRAATASPFRPSSRNPGDERSRNP